MSCGTHTTATYVFSYFALARFRLFAFKNATSIDYGTLSVPQLMLKFKKECSVVWFRTNSRRGTDKR